MKPGDLIRATAPVDPGDSMVAEGYQHVGIYLETMSDGRFKGDYISLLVNGEVIMIPEWVWSIEVINGNR